MVASSVAVLKSHLRTPLYRNGYALMINSVATSGLGMAYWVIAARIYPPHLVGANAAAISALMLLSSLAQFNFSSILARFIPQTGNNTARLILSLYLVSFVTAMVVSIVFVIGLHSWPISLGFFHPSVWFLFCFVIANMGWTVFALQDAVLTGLRQAIWVPVENTIFAVTKIALLLPLATFLPTYGIFASWTIPSVILLVPVNLLIFAFLLPKHVATAAARALPLVREQFLRYVGGDYLGSMFPLLGNMIIPLLVIHEAGATVNAYFYQPWIIAGSIQLLTMNMSTSLLVEGATDQAKLHEYAYRVLASNARLVTPAALLVCLLAPYILSLYGGHYAAEGTTLLRLLALTAIPSVINWVYGSVARVQRRIGRVVLLQGCLFVLTIGLSAVLLPRYGITGIGVARFLTVTTVAVVVFVVELRPVVRHGGTTWQGSAS